MELADMGRANLKFHKLLSQAELRRLFLRTVLLFLLVVILACLSVAHFNSQVYLTVYEQNMSSVNQMSGYFTRTFHAKLSSCFQILETAETFIHTKSGWVPEDVVTQLEPVKDSTGFTSLGVVDLQGNAYSTNHIHKNIQDAEFFQEVLKGNRYISDVFEGEAPNAENMILLAIPFYDGDKIVGALYGRYLVQDIVSNLDWTQNESSYFQIVDSQGHYISRSVSDNVWASKDQNEIWSEMARYDCHQTGSPEQVRADMQAGKSGSFYCTFKNEGRYVSYQPIGINQWYVFSMLPEQNVDQSASAMRRLALSMMVKISLCIIAIGLACVLYVCRMYCLVQDKNAFLEVHNRLFQSVLKKTKDIPFEVDLRRQEITLHSPRFSASSYTLPLSKIHPSFLASHNLLDPTCVKAYEAVYESVLRGEANSQAIIHISCQNKMTWFKILLLDVYRRPSDTHIVGVLEYYNDQKEKDLEIERRKQQALHLSKRSQYDFLTHLLNRQTFEIMVNEYLSHPSSRISAFLMLDLDSFKAINDTMGHAKGDEVLREVADILKHQFRKDDLIGRLGGDEFVILLKDLDSDAVIEKLATNLNSVLRKTYTQDDISLSISASIGIARAPVDGTTFAELYRKADMALYAVKRQNKNSFHIYHHNT